MWLTLTLRGVLGINSVNIQMKYWVTIIIECSKSCFDFTVSCLLPSFEVKVKRRGQGLKVQGRRSGSRSMVKVKVKFMACSGRYLRGLACRVQQEAITLKFEVKGGRISKCSTKNSFIFIFLCLRVFHVPNSAGYDISMCTVIDFSCRQ